MIKESKLIGSVIDAPFGWKEFKVGYLFDNHQLNTPNISGHSGYVTDDLVIDKGGTTPYLAAVTSNNGISGFSKMVPNNEGDVITLSTTTLSGDTLFYQSKPFIGRQQMQALKLKNHDYMGPFLAMFMISLLKPQLQSFNYGNKLTVNKLLNISLELPVTQDEQPDYGWMSSYIRELENQRIRELDTYLQVTGLADITLTDNELQVLEQWRRYEKFGGTLLTKRFKVGDLFDVLLSAGDNKVSDLPKGDIPLITSGASNNGIAGFVAFGDGDAQLFDKGVLTADMFGNVLFQPKAFYAVSHGRVNILKPLDADATILPLLFIASLIKKQTIGRYGFDYMLSSTRLHELIIELPVTADDIPYYDFMQTFMRAQKKLVMQHLDKFRQLQIDTTKAVI